MSHSPAPEEFPVRCGESNGEEKESQLSVSYAPEDPGNLAWSSLLECVLTAFTA